MMLQKSVTDFLFQVLVLGQPLFFMWLYETDKLVIRERFRWSFYVISFSVLGLIYNSGFNVGFYTNSLLLQYGCFTLIAVNIFNTRYDIKKAISLGFLTVFLNSYYWEIPLHLAEILSGSLHVGMVVQLWRLIPLTLFLKEYRFNAEHRAVLSIGLAFSTVIMFLQMVYGGASLYLYPLNRLFCLCLLVKVLIEASRKTIVGNHNGV